EFQLHNDLQVTKKESQVILYWKNNLTKEETEKYSVKYILSYMFFNTSQERKIVDVTEEKYEYQVLRPVRKCTAQVRAKKEVCITNKIWSDWSEPVIIYDERTVDSIVLSLTLSGLLVFLGSLLICMCRRYRFLEVVTMPFPSPTDKLTTWLAADETHHQKQNSMQMEMQSEIILRISEDSGDEDIQQHGHFKEFEDL
ncbi:UNVERIFIED_CONTAM: hypothetical protein H355_003454, partial [Colinus virginianus]